MTEKLRIVITDHGFDDIERERGVIEQAGFLLEVAECRTAQDVISCAQAADALLVQWAPVTAEVLAASPRCKLVVRYGIGFDNIDIAAANDAGVAVCNVPDYCIDEVADHTIAMVLSLSRQLHQVDARVRSGTWRIVPDRRLPAARDMTFGTLGFGRVARAVMDRAAAFGFARIAYDPAGVAAPGVESVTLSRLLRESDVISLHAPLTAETRHVINDEALAGMKRDSILVNTGRGGLVDLDALADSLRTGHLGGAGLDVYEEEPLPITHRIRDAPNAILTSHVAWYSEQSVPRLQVMAAEEVVRGLQGETLLNPVGLVREVGR